MGRKKNPSELEKAVRTQAESLDPAQKEFVLAEYETYKWNKLKIEDIQRTIDAGECDIDAEKKLLTERHQLVSEQSALFSHIMRWLKGTATGKDPFDEFISG